MLLRVNREAQKFALSTEGGGRNAVIAAKQGWNVTAFDTSEVLKEKAIKKYQ